MSLDALQRRLTKAEASAQKQTSKAASFYQVVLFDAATGDVLPAWRGRAGVGFIYIPDNGRDTYAAKETL